MPAITPEMRVVMEEAADDLRRGILDYPLPAGGFPWELRRPGEMTTVYLGRVLDDAGMPGLARRAREGHFDDFAAPAEHADGLELVRLVAELRLVAKSAADAGAENAGRLADDARLIEQAVKCGEFDATKAEGDRWAASKDGQDTFARLTGDVNAQQAVDLIARLAKGVGRNDPCPCGSGAKWKRCHGR